MFPGGVGTAEEILYLLGILLNPANRTMRLPLVFSGPAASADYFTQIDRFLRFTLGETVAERYRIIIDDPQAVGNLMAIGAADYRRATSDAFYFNWALTIEHAYQQPFEPTHDNIAALDLSRQRPAHELAADLRRVFSAIVAGNLKEDGIRQIERFGPYLIKGDAEIMAAMDALLATFVDQQRMKLPGAIPRRI